MMRTRAPSIYRSAAWAKSAEFRPKPSSGSRAEPDSLRARKNPRKFPRRACLPGDQNLQPRDHENEFPHAPRRLAGHCRHPCRDSPSGRASGRHVLDERRGHHHLGTTIWARLDGLEGNRLVLNLRGKTYRVPMNRLAPRSIEKARLMLKLSPEKADRLAGISRPKGVIPPVAMKAVAKPMVPISRPEPAQEAPRQMEEMEIAAIPEPVDEELPPPTETLPVSLGTAVDCSDRLPDFNAGIDPSADGYGAVLPSRESLIPPETAEPGSEIRLEGSTAIAPVGVPDVILTAIEAGNRLQTKYYKWGGGRARLEDSGYDCSGSVSYVLIKAGLLRSPLTSGSFTRYGSSGPGRWITIHARHGHVFMTICGLRLDTGGHGGRGESGPRWRAHMRGTSGFVMRHPPGL